MRKEPTPLGRLTRILAWLVPISLVLAIAGCGTASVPSASPSSTPPALPRAFQVALPPDVVVTVIDQSGAVLGAEPWIPDLDDFRPDFDQGPLAISGAGNIVRVAWLGRPCDSRPSVVISGDMTGIHVDLFSGPLPAGIACSDLGVTRGVDLAMTAIPDAYSKRYRQGSPP